MGWKRGEKKGGADERDGAWGELSAGWETWDVERRRRGEYELENGQADTIGEKPITGAARRHKYNRTELTTLEFGRGDRTEMSVSFSLALGESSRGETSASEMDTSTSSRNQHSRQDFSVSSSSGADISIDLKGKGRLSPLSSSDDHILNPKPKENSSSKSAGLSVHNPGLGTWNASSHSHSGFDTSGLESVQMHSFANGVSPNGGTDDESKADHTSASPTQS